MPKYKIEGAAMGKFFRILVISSIYRWVKISLNFFVSFLKFCQLYDINVQKIANFFLYCIRGYLSEKGSSSRCFSYVSVGRKISLKAFDISDILLHGSNRVFCGWKSHQLPIKSYWEILGSPKTHFVPGSNRLWSVL